MTLFTPIRKTLLVAGIVIGSAVHAQYNFDAGFSLGGANYLGDMGGGALTRRDFVADMKMSQTQPTTSVFVRYKMSPFLAIKSTLSWVRISGDDKLSTNPGRNARNLNFRNDIYELSAQAQFIFYDLNDLGRSHGHQDNFRAFIGLGAGIMYHSPKTLYNGEYVALRPLMTEGEAYSKFVAVIPATGGFYFTLDKKYRIGFDLTWRTTFSDYLDDVSTTYADPSALPNSLAVELANRTDELSYISPAFAENFTPGNKRGDAKHNDSYLTSSVEFSYAFMGHSAAEKGIYKWLQRRQRHPSKFDGVPGHRRHHKVRKIRLKW